MPSHIAAAYFNRSFSNKDPILDLSDAETRMLAAALGEPKQWQGSSDVPALRQVLSESPDVLKRIGEPLLAITVFTRGCSEGARFLLAEGVPFNVDTSRGNYNVLHEAAWAGNAEGLRAVFEAGAADIGSIADPHTGWPVNVTLMFWAAHGGFVELAKVLLEFGIGEFHDVPIKRNGERGDSPLLEALSPSPYGDPEKVAGRLTVAQLLLDDGVAYNLYAACARGDVDRLHALEAESPGVFTPDAAHTYDMTPLHWAARAGSLDCATILIKNHQADVNALNKSKRTPLQLATDENQVDMIKLLATHGADLDTQDKVGRTPLHRATYNGKAEAAEALLEAGADTTIQNKKGKTALEIARMGAKYLKDRG
ncbi:MAG: ankyrin repeat domain-containing protein [Pseudomonadota bacterium]